MRSKENKFISNLKSKAQKNRVLFFLLLPAIMLRRLWILIDSRIVMRNLRRLNSKVPGTTVVISVDHFGGRFEIGSSSDILDRILRGDVYEKELSEIVARKINRSSDAIDCGANVGFFSVFMASLIGPENRVLSIEPSPAARERLAANLRLNDVSGKVQIFAGAASNLKGHATLSYPPGKEEYSTLGRVVHPEVAGARVSTVDVKLDTIDNIVDRLGLNPGFMKIDVEGHEYKVIEGARETLLRTRPIILAEASSILLADAGSSVDALLTLLGDLGYETLDTQGNSVHSSFVGDILAVPRGK